MQCYENIAQLLVNTIKGGWGRRGRTAHTFSTNRYKWSCILRRAPTVHIISSTPRRASGEVGEGGVEGNHNGAASHFLCVFVRHRRPRRPSDVHKRVAHAMAVPVVVGFFFVFADGNVRSNRA